MKKIGFFILLLAAMPMLMITSCNKKEVSKQAANVKFKITDAPAQFDALYIDVKGILVHSQGGGSIMLNSDLGTINILSYVNGNSALIASSDLSAGATIDRVSLVLGSNNSIVVNGQSFNLNLGSSSGLTIDLNAQLQSSGDYVWTLDFDAAQSIIANAAGSYSLNPVIRLIVDPASVNIGGSASASASGSGSGSGSVGAGIDGSGTGGGSIDLGGSAGGSTSGSGSGSGSVDLGLGGSGSGSGSVTVGGNLTGSISGSVNPSLLSSVCITGPNGTSICTMTSLGGSFSLQAVSAGTYTITVTSMASLIGSSSATISNVHVSAGSNTNVGVISM